MAQLKKSKGLSGLRKNVFVSGLVSFFMDISSEMIYPLVPLFLANTLGVNKSVIGLIEGVAESTASILKVLSGWLSDRIGNRKWLTAAGYAISTASRPILALAPGWRHVMASRFMDRFGKGVRTAPRDAIIADSTERAFLGRAFGFHRAMDTMGAMLGPALAFSILLVFPNNYRLIFWLSILPGAIAVLLIILFIEERRGTEPEGLHRPAPAIMHLNRRFKWFIVIAAIFALGNSSDAFLILRAQQLGVSAREIPIIYLLFNLIYSLSALPAGMAADKFGRRRIIFLGFMLFSAVYCGFGTARNKTAVWFLFAAYGVFMGLSEGVQKAFVAAIIPPERKATAFGIYNTIIGAAMLPASLVGGWLWDHIAPAATFYFGAATSAVAGISFLIFMAASKN
ncbi:MAG: MFS transporter [Desulfobacteraceae bacterium]|nr:MFS transporter [Desulfobacteraceae bacterium]